MVKARTEYKKCIRLCRYRYDKQNTDKLLNARFKNAKLYWSMLKQSAGVKRANIPLTDFEQYFRAINNPDDRFFNEDEDIFVF